MEHLMKDKERGSVNRRSVLDRYANGAMSSLMAPVLGRAMKRSSSRWYAENNGSC